MIHFSGLQILSLCLLNVFGGTYALWASHQDLLSSQEDVRLLKIKVDSLTYTIEVVRDSAAEDQDSQIQSNALWWMHRCEQDAADARASANSAMRPLVRGFRRQSRGYWCACDAPATTPAASQMRRDSTITLPADHVGGPSLY